MEATLQALNNYLHETLGLQLKLKLWKDKKSLPIYLRNLYIFYHASLLEMPCILAVARESDAVTPAKILKHLSQLQEKAGMPCIYVSASISSYNRKRLVAHRVQFVIPDRQIYLPALGIDWLESCQEYQKQRAAPKAMSPSTQVVVIYALMHQSEKHYIPLELAKALNYSRMTMTRALNDLESFGLGKTLREGKERLFSFIEDRFLLWSKVEPLMQSPVKRRLWLKKNSSAKIKREGTLAGLSALAELSMLSSPTHPVYAISLQAWKALQHSGEIQALPSEEEAAIELEIWSYEPGLFAKKGLIDMFSLFLSLRENQDERVEMALKKLMKGIKW